MIATTNRNLQEAMQTGSFREDLFYRLNVVSFTLPPLRDRKEDIPALSEYFLRQYKLEAKRRFDDFEEEAMSLLIGHSWPGNVRELANAIERAVVLGRGPPVETTDLPLSVGTTESVSTGGVQRSDLPYHEAIEWRDHRKADRLCSP